VAAALELEGVHKRYGDVAALRGLDLDVAAGELLVLVGPSGCGKTTALRAAAGLEEVTEGTIRIGGRDVTRLLPAARNVAMVFQNHALFPHLSVAENIGFGLRARKVARGEARERISSAARTVGCEALLERKPHELSGGERQRVALARALVREPDVFLLDEPLSNLDAQLRVEMRAELRRLHDRLGATMVYVTHDQVEALTMGDRVAVLSEGVVQQVGEPDAVYRRPANRFVATFVGSPAMNILSAQDEGGRLRAGPFTFDRPPGTADRPLEIGIRPEHLALVPDGVRALVEVVEVAGNEAFLHLDARGTRLVARVGPEQRPAAGSTVALAVAVPGSVHVFDAETGVALT
jgi:ABC-type sugar transport system ATPase subunit